MDAKTYALLNKKVKATASGIKNIKPNTDGTAIVYTLNDDNNTTFSITIKNMHTHMNLDVLNLFTKDSSNNLMFDGKVITTGDNIDLSNYYNKTEIDNKLLNKSNTNHTHSNYIEKVENYGLSKNDFTDEYKNKIDNTENILNKKANTTHTHTVKDIIDINNSYYTKTETLNKTEINTLISNISKGMNWKSAVTRAELNSLSDNQESDTRVISDESMIVIYSNGTWVNIGNSSNVAMASKDVDGLMSKEDYVKLTNIVISDLVTNKTLPTTLADYVLKTSLDNYALKNHTHDNYIEKVDGKSLSTNDYTNDEKAKLSTLKNYDDTIIKEDIKLKADKTYVDSSVENNYKFKGSVDTSDDLPVDAKIGDIYKVVDIDSNMVWLGDVIKWNSTSSNVDLTEYQTTLQSDNKYISKTDFNSEIADYAKTNDVTTTLENYSEITHNHDLVYSKLGHTHNKNEVGLDKVDNTSDLEKPVSNDVKKELDKKLDNTIYDTDKGSTNINIIGDGTITGAIKSLDDNCVKKEDRKGLSTNDFTNELKIKLNGLSNYELPTASATVLGGIKIGNDLSIDKNGVLSAKNYINDTQANDDSTYSSNKINTLLDEKVSNEKYGNVDISSIGDGTITGAIKELKDNADIFATDEDINAMFS